MSKKSSESWVIVPHIMAKGHQLAQSFCKEIVSCPTPQAHVALNAPTLKVFDCSKIQKLWRTRTRNPEGERMRKCTDTEASMLSGISRQRKIRSNPYWFTEFCNSQCLSHFAAPFIVAWAETSVAESCEYKTHKKQGFPIEKMNHVEAEKAAAGTRHALPTTHQPEGEWAQK